MVYIYISAPEWWGWWATTSGSGGDCTALSSTSSTYQALALNFVALLHNKLHCISINKLGVVQYKLTDLYPSLLQCFLSSHIFIAMEM